MIALIAVCLICYGIFMFACGVKWAGDRLEQAMERARAVRWHREDEGV